MAPAGLPAQPRVLGGGSAPAQQGECHPCFTAEGREGAVPMDTAVMGGITSLRMRQLPATAGTRHPVYGAVGGAWVPTLEQAPMPAEKLARAERGEASFLSITPQQELTAGLFGLAGAPRWAPLGAGRPAHLQQLLAPSHAGVQGLSLHCCFSHTSACHTGASPGTGDSTGARHGGWGPGPPISALSQGKGQHPHFAESRSPDLGLQRLSCQPLKPQQPEGVPRLLAGRSSALTPPNFLHLFRLSYLGEAGCCYAFSSASI